MHNADWFVVAAYLATCVVPFWRIFPRAGVPKWLALTGLMPLAPIIFVWVLAFMKWPEDATKKYPEY